MKKKKKVEHGTTASSLVYYRSLKELYNYNKNRIEVGHTPILNCEQFFVSIK